MTKKITLWTGRTCWIPRLTKRGYTLGKLQLMPTRDIARNSVLEIRNFNKKLGN